MSRDSSSSSYREMVLEHLFVGELMRHAWLTDLKRIEILQPEVDDGGYDLVVEANNIFRHIQLKTTFLGSKVNQFSLHLGLAGKPSGCLIVLQFDPVTLNIGQYLWFGGKPGSKLPDLSGFKVGKHTKANAQGKKTARPMMRVIPKGKLTPVAGIDTIVDKLFGTGIQARKVVAKASSVLPTTQRGAHRRSSERDYADKRDANIAAYYLSKFEHGRLGIGDQSKTFAEIARRLGVKKTTLQNARDIFDPHTGSHRRGWRDRTGAVKALAPQFAEIHRKYSGYSEAELRRVVLGGR